MRLFYDLHIHTALSPCGDNDMSPVNIVNMAILKGLDVIAITDHNSVKNCLPCIEVAKNQDLIVIPGMEIQTKEEVHLLCLFKNIKDALRFEDNIENHMPNKLNNPDFFGEQLVFDEKNNIIDKEERLLIASVDFSMNKVFSMVTSLNGVVIPAHLDKKNFSVISNLGFLPNDIKITTIEISKNCNRKKFISDNSYLEKYNIVTNSDAHYLGDISEAENYIEVNKKDIEAVLKFLRA